MMSLFHGDLAKGGACKSKVVAGQDLGIPGKPRSKGSFVPLSELS